MYDQNKAALASENIDFNEFNIESDTVQAINLNNIIENRENNESSKVKILCQQIISESNENSENVILKPLDIEKDGSNLVGETKHISEFLCNDEVYLNSQLIEDIFTDSSSFNRENNIVSPLTTTESDKSDPTNNEQAYDTPKCSLLKPLNSDDNLKNSILKTTEQIPNSTSNQLIKRIKKKVSFDEAELVNTVKNRKNFVNKESKVINNYTSKKRINKRRISEDQVYSTTVEKKKNDYKCDIKLMDEGSLQRKPSDVIRKKKRKIVEERLIRKKQPELPQNKGNRRVPHKKSDSFQKNEIFIFPSEKFSNNDAEEEINIFDESDSRNSSKVCQTCKLKLNFNHCVLLL